MTKINLSHQVSVWLIFKTVPSKKDWMGNESNTEDFQYLGLTDERTDRRTDEQRDNMPAFCYLEILSGSIRSLENRNFVEVPLVPGP